MVDLGVAENRNAVDVEALDDGEVIRGAVGQIAVVIVRLQDIKQNVGVRLSFAAVGSSGLQTGVGIDEQRHRSIPIAAHQQVRIVPRTTYDFSVCVHLTDQIFRVHLGVCIVDADAVLVVGVESLADLSNVSQTHGPQVCVALVHGTVVEAGVEAVVEIPIDAVAVFVPDHVSDQRSRIAAAAHIVEVDALAIIERIAFAGHIDVSWKRPIQIIEIRHQLLHVLVN